MAETVFSAAKSPRASQSGIPIYADTHELTKLARDLAEAAPLAWKAARVGLRAAGELVAEDARQRVGYSSRIEWSIKTRVMRGNVKVVAGGEGAPNAAPIENKGKGFVRHPVFVPRSELPGPPGSWTSKNSRPAFLAPALDAHREEVLTMIEESVVHAVEMAIGSK